MIGTGIHASSAHRFTLLACLIGLLVLGLTMTPSSLRAQLSMASVTGVVTDPSGAPIPGATVRLRNVETSVERVTLTNEVGHYSFLQVAPGRYTLTVSKEGFRTSQLEPFTIAVNQAAAFDVRLELGTLEQTVTVEATTEMLEATSAGLGTVVNERQVVDLPLNGRNFTQLLILSPGVSPISVGQNAGGGGAAVTEGSQFVMPAINGQTNRSVLYYTDGIINAGTFFGTYGVAPIIDALQEFKVNAHPDQAEFGGALGGYINTATKSGTNEFHGSLWEFVRNDALDARNTFLATKTKFRQNQYGLAAGGPVWVPHVYHGRNHTFFYFAWQGFRYREPQNSFFRVPTEANLRGDFSDVPTQLFNPWSTREDPNLPGAFLRDPFPGNQIPASLLDQGMIAYARAVLPPARDVGVAGRNALDQTPKKQDQNEYNIRIDHNVNERNQFWFRYTAVSQKYSASAGLPSLPTKIERPGQNFGASFVHTFSPKTILQAQYGRLHTEVNQVTKFANVAGDLAKTIGYAPSFINYVSGDTLLPNIIVSGYFSGGEAISLEPALNDIHQLKANVSRMSGSHMFSFGGEFDPLNYESFYEYGFVRFDPHVTANPANSAQVGNALAAFVLGVPGYAAQRNVHETFRFGGYMGFYVQDAWKITPALTVNIGLRYDRMFIPGYGTEDTVGKPGGIETGNLDLNTGTYYIQRIPPTCAERGHAPCLPTADGSLPPGVVLDPRGKLLYDTKTNWGPRLGIAYRVRPATVIRTGFGIFYDNWAATAQRAQGFGGNWPDVALRILNNLNVPKPGSPLPTVTVRDPLGPNLPGPTPFDRTQRYVDPHIRNPYSIQWNFAIQHALASHTALTVAYVGSSSHRLSVAAYTNVAVTPGPGDPRLRRPYPHIASTYFETSSGNSNYNALQVHLDRRLQSGLALQVAYTWSKSIDMACSGFFGVEGCSVQDPYHTRMDRSVSGFDVPHMLSAGVIYDIPVGPGRAFRTGNRALDYLLGNWQVNALLMMRSGTPYHVQISSDIPNTGNLGVRANLVGEHKLDHPTREMWFNPKAFAVPPRYTFGNLGRNSLRTDGYWNLDLSVFRRFPLGERARLEFRAEAFNMPNTVVYGTPDNNLASTTLGRVYSTANRARQIQLGMKLLF